MYQVTRIDHIRGVALPAAVAVQRADAARWWVGTDRRMWRGRSASGHGDPPAGFGRQGKGWSP